MCTSWYGVGDMYAYFHVCGGVYVYKHMVFLRHWGIHVLWAYYDSHLGVQDSCVTSGLAYRVLRGSLNNTSLQYSWMVIFFFFEWWIFFILHWSRCDVNTFPVKNFFFGFWGAFLPRGIFSWFSSLIIILIWDVCYLDIL